MERLFLPKDNQIMTLVLSGKAAHPIYVPYND